LSQEQQEQFFGDEHENNFLNSIRSKASRKAYLYYFSKYREYNKGDIICNNDRKLIENKIVDFLLSLKKRDSSQNYIRANFAAIIHFYTMNDIILNRNKIAKFLYSDQKRKGSNTAYTNEQIHKLLHFCDERLKAIILIYVSTGIRLAALTALKIGDLKLTKIMDGESEIYEIAVYQGRRIYNILHS
jgi:integrase